MVNGIDTQKQEYKPYPDFPDILNGVLEKVGRLENLNEGQLSKLWKQKQEIARLKRNNPLIFYKPYESRVYKGRFPQDLFHRSLTKIRQICGGNRSGKSEAGTVEDVWWATGTHPYRSVPVPSRGWIVGLDFNMCQNIIDPKLRKWLPPSMIKRWWTTDDRTIYLTNGSEIVIKSCDQDIPKFGGDAVDWIHFDEEPPGQRGYQIYQECLMRTIDKKGCLWFTLTPVLGMSWSYDEIYSRGGIDPDVFVVDIETYENPHLNKEEIDKVAGNLSQDEKDMRLKGKYVQFAGLIYKEFKRDKHIIEPFVIPSDWKRFRSIDHGINNPTACIWMAVSPKDEYYVYDEYYETDKTIKENCEAIKVITGSDKIEWTTIDPSTEARDPQTGKSDRKDYFDNGIITKAQRTERLNGINAIKQLLQDNESTKRPRLFFFNNCFNTIREMSRYRWKMHKGKDDRNLSEEPVKVLDHALDALRYLVMSRPRYDIQNDEDLNRMNEDNYNWY